MFEWLTIDILTRYVLGKPLSAHGPTLVAAVSKWIPYCRHRDIGVVSRVNENVLYNTLSDKGLVNENMDIEVGDGGRIVRGVRKVDKSVQGKRSGRGVGDRNVAHLEV